MRTLGWPYPFREVPWGEIHGFLAGMADRYPKFEHMARLPDSVIKSGATELLAGCTSMHDLIVVPRPIPTPPYDVIVVRAPGSLHQPPTGMVRITHLTATGSNDSVDRPVAETLPLFWRFIIEKYGIHPPTPPD